ncbi:Coatomer subunit beta'-2 [Glycine max]|nr:Coatomer subunit beta'-2 [Glycine max]
MFDQPFRWHRFGYWTVLCAVGKEQRANAKSLVRLGGDIIRFWPNFLQCPASSDLKSSVFRYEVFVAHFLESRGMIEDALEVPTDPDYRFDLPIQLGKLDAKSIAIELQSEQQLGELAMFTGN